MRRMLAAGLMAVIAFGFAPASADRFTDEDCSHANAEGSATVERWQGKDEEGREEPLRAALCVSNGNAEDGAELYVGGEVDTESSQNAACGSVEVAGMQGTGTAPDIERLVFGDDDWGGDDCQ